MGAGAGPVPFYDGYLKKTYLSSKALRVIYDFLV